MLSQLIASWSPSFAEKVGLVGKKKSGKPSFKKNGFFVIHGRIWRGYHVKVKLIRMINIIHIYYIHYPATCYHIFWRDCPVLPWNRNVMCQIPVQEILLPSLLLFSSFFNCEELNGVLYLLAFFLWNYSSFHQKIIIVNLVLKHRICPTSC